MRLPVRGVYELKHFLSCSRTTYGPKNPFSDSSSKVIKEVFDRSKKFSFSVILGRAKVGRDDFPIIISIGKTHGKPWFLDSILTLRRPKIMENENFSNRLKNPFSTRVIIRFFQPYIHLNPIYTPKIAQNPIYTLYTPQKFSRLRRDLKHYKIIKQCF